MASPIVNNISPTFGPVTQWVYLFGSNFVSDETKVYFNGVICNGPEVYTDNQMGVNLPDGASGTGVFTVTTSDGTVDSEPFTIGVPTLDPVVVSITPHSDPTVNWIYVNGSNFYCGQTTITYNDVNTMDLLVYSTESGGFTKLDPNEVITKILVTTPIAQSAPLILT
jgi:hypothetical protein